MYAICYIKYTYLIPLRNKTSLQFSCQSKLSVLSQWIELIDSVKTKQRKKLDYEKKYTSVVPINILFRSWYDTKQW